MESKEKRKQKQQRLFSMTRSSTSSNNNHSRHSFSSPNAPSIFSPIMSRSAPKKTMFAEEINSYSSPRPSFCADTACRKPSPRRGVSAWALSPGRMLDIDMKTETLAPRRRSVDIGRRSVDFGRMSGGSVGTVMALFAKRKKLEPEQEENLHRIRILTVRLTQWRFVNARANSAMDRRRFVSERKLFYAWLRISEMRNMVAAKRVLLQRGRLKLKLVRVLVPQVQLLMKWEHLARQQIEAVAVLAKILGTMCLSLPLVEGAQANIVSVLRCMRVSMDTMKDIETKSKIFYSKAESVRLLLGDLAETIRLEIEGLHELINLCQKINLLEMEETSLRSNLIQATKLEDENVALSKPLALHRYMMFRTMPASLSIDF